ncbi:MAG TPA: hypothetical protein VG944_11845 [Fimbriimonas sp.]|nr:hypothetical protein [Fimbriimonas sp.]
MSVSTVGSSAANAPDVATDPQVRNLKAQIKDWTNCPTTPPQTKKVIVDRLQNRLDGVISSIEKHDSAKPQPGRIDISV